MHDALVITRTDTIPQLSAFALDPPVSFSFRSHLFQHQNEMGGNCGTEGTEDTKVKKRGAGVTGSSEAEGSEASSWKS